MIGKHTWQAQILDVIRYVLLLQHPSDLDEVTSRENANLSTIKTGSIVPREIASLSLGCPGPEPAYTPPPPPRGGGGGEGGFYHMVISGYLDHQSTQFRLSASELLLFMSVVLVLINALYGIPNCDDLVS